MSPYVSRRGLISEMDTSQPSFFISMDLFQHPNMSKAIQNAQNSLSKIAKCSEIH